MLYFVVAVVFVDVVVDVVAVRTARAVSVGKKNTFTVTSTLRRQWNKHSDIFLKKDSVLNVTAYVNVLAFYDKCARECSKHCHLGPISPTRCKANTSKSWAVFSINDILQYNKNGLDFWSFRLAPSWWNWAQVVNYSCNLNMKKSCHEYPWEPETVFTKTA